MISLAQDEKHQHNCCRLSPVGNSESWTERNSSGRYQIRLEMSSFLLTVAGSSCSLFLPATSRLTTSCHYEAQKYSTPNHSCHRCCPCRSVGDVFWSWPRSGRNPSKGASSAVLSGRADNQQPPQINDTTSPPEDSRPVAANAPARSPNPGTNGARERLQGSDGQISAHALEQIRALEAEKAHRTPVQQKIDSQLLSADKMRRGLPVAEGVPTQRVDLDKDEQGRVLVDIKAEVTAALLRFIETLGGRVINSFPEYQAIRAGIPLGGVETLAARAEVRFAGACRSCEPQRRGQRGRRHPPSRHRLVPRLGWMEQGSKLASCPPALTIWTAPK